MLIWHDTAWTDYLYWQTQDKKTLKRINMLIKDIERNGTEGIGKPEPLKGDLTGFWSRRIDDRHRLVYCIMVETGDIQIAQCKEHYAGE
ncbi:MAG: Txe/YoeB family addiction module toxin [Desulfovibrio sp.]|jgi:toxin YoeB|nr:Txe/YoeB family addiction module toxin [Desulfovibrio sp.]